MFRYDETSRREALISIDQVTPSLRVVLVHPWLMHWMLQRLAYGATVSGNKRPRKILFFPEGSWTNGQCLISFKTAAFRLGFPVLPFALEYPHQNLNIAGVGRAASCIFMVRIMLQVRTVCSSC